MPAWEQGSRSGTRGAQPTLGIDHKGTLYFVEDEGIVERWDGTSWIQIAIDAAPTFAPVWTAWTPTFKAGVTTLTASGLVARYMVVGEITFWTIKTTFSTGGTGVFNVTNLPAALTTTLAREHVGDGIWWDEGVTYHHLAVYANSTTKWDLMNTYPDHTPVVASPDGFSGSGFVRTV